MPAVNLVLGTHVYAGSPDTARRERSGVESLLALNRVHPMNVQFAKNPTEAEGIETLPQLRLDSVKTTGRKAARKPIVSEIFNVLAAEALRRRASFFGYVNSDTLVSQRCVDLALEGHYEACIFSRMDFDRESQADLGMVTAGQDLFLINTSWWSANFEKFRPYIIGERTWDNVYTSKLLCFSKSILLNKTADLRHEAHSQRWKASPYAEYTHLLATLDAPFFSLWVVYWEALQRLRSRQADEVEELALQKRVFVWAPSRFAEARQIGRQVKAWFRYWTHTCLRNQ